MLDNEDSTVAAYLSSREVETNAPVKQSTAAAELEAKGWREWLMTLCPFAFEEEFSADHVKFWDLFWSVLLRIREQKKYFDTGVVPDDPDHPELQEQFFRKLDIFIEDYEYVILCIWGRGMAKSSSVEAGAAVRACLLGGYTLYCCEAQDQAEEHLGNIKSLIDSEDSRIVEFYPHMAIDENAVFKGKKTKNRTDLFITAGGYICRAKGLNAKLRGIRVGNLRPDHIILDDADSVNDSIAVSIKKVKQIQSSIVPTQARRHATIHGGQNLIGETTVFNLMYTGQVDLLSARTVIGVSNTFEQFRLNHEYTTYINDEDGRVRHKILPSAVPTWKGVDIAAAQKFLNDSGLETFLAEYMNSFAHQKMGKVFAFEEARHVIPWDDFGRVVGVRHIPGHWRAKASADLGYTPESLSVWQFTARAAKNAAPSIAGLYFAYRSMSFEMDSIDDQAIEIWKKLFPDPEIGKQNFEATQRFLDYPELFRVLDLDPQCSRYLKRFAHDTTSDQYKLLPADPMKLSDISDEEKALFYVKQANKTFKSQIQSWAISHEATGAQKTLAKMYGIPAVKVKRFEKDAGVDEANHLLRGDYTRPHPFFPDEIVKETGLYRLGCPYLFFLVRRVKAPEDDRDMKIAREHIGNQRYTQEKLTELGISRAVPMKYRSDGADALRHFAVDYALPESTRRTIAEEVLQRTPEQYHRKEGEVVTPEQQMSMQAAREEAERRTKIELGLIDPEDEEYEDY